MWVDDGAGGAQAEVGAHVLQVRLVLKDADDRWYDWSVRPICEDHDAANGYMVASLDEGKRCAEAIVAAMGFAPDVRVFVSRTGWQTWLDRREIVAVEEGAEHKPGRRAVVVTYRSGVRFELLGAVDEFVAWWRGGDR